MPDPSPARPPFRSQIRAMLALAVRQKRNQIGRRRASPKHLRSATAHKNDRKSGLAVLFGLLFVAMSFNFSYQAVHGLAQHANSLRPAETRDGAPLKVSPLTHFYLEHFPLAPGEDEDEDAANRGTGQDQLVDSLVQSDSFERAAAEKEAQRLISHLEKHGLEGFVIEERANPYKFVDLRTLSPGAKIWFGRVIALIVTCLAVALTLMPLSTRTKDLGALDSQLEWFFCLPLSGREILSGRFASMTFVRPLTWIIAWPLFSVLFWAMGFGWLALLMGLAVTLAISITSTGIELGIETWLRTAASFRTRKNVQSLATIVGTLAFYISMAAGISASRSTGWLTWVLDHTPPVLTGLPGQFLMLPTGSAWGFLQLAALAGGASALCGVGGWMLAAKALKQGLSSGTNQQGRRSERAAISGNPSLARFEWLLLRRDRNLATLVLIVPLMLVFYQFLINPEMLAVISAQKLAVIGFGVGAWAAIVTGPHVLMSESNSIWMIFSLPVDIAGYFQRRARVWRTTGVTMAAAVITGLAIWKGGIPLGGSWRLAAGLVGVWVVSLSIYALMIGNASLPDVSQGERPRVSATRMYACMVLSAIVGTLLWRGTIWQVTASLVLWWFLGCGLWQGLSLRLRHLMEPTERTPGQLTVATALFAVIVFFLVQVLVAGIWQAVMPDQIATGALLSYVLAGLVALLFCWSRLSRHQLPRAEPTPLNLGLALSLAVATCISFGWIWLRLIDLTPPLRELRESARADAVLQFDLSDWRLILLFVLAAPLIEEALFRGFVFRIMQSAWSPRTGIVACALLFAIVHPALSFPPVFLLGLATSWLYFRSRKLWPGMLLHGLYNAAVLAMS